MRAIGSIVKSNRESKKVQRYFFNKGGEWSAWGKNFYKVPIGMYGTLITLHNNKNMGFFQIEDLNKLELAYELFDIMAFGGEKLKI